MAVDQMYNKYRRPGRKVSWGRVGQSAASGAIEGGTLGAKFGPKGAVVGATIGATVGGVTGYLSSPKEIDPLIYQGMIDKYAKGRRFKARTAANQLSADLGASLAARGLNQSQLGAGVVAGNRGRLMASAEQDIGDFEAGILERIAQAEYNAEHAENEQVRQGWLNLAQQIAVTAADIGGSHAAGKATETAERRAVEAQSLARDYTDEITGTQRDAQHILDSVSDIPERKTGQSLPGSTESGASPSSVKVDPIRIDSPSVRELGELFDDESRTLLGAMLPGYEQDIAEMDEILKEEGVKGGTSAPVTAEPHELEEVVVSAPRSEPPAADLPVAELDEVVVSAPRPSEGAVHISGDETAYEYEKITSTFGIDESTVPAESYQGLPSYYPIILETEGGYNPSDPSTAGVWQVSYDEFLNFAENASSYPRGVGDLSPSNIRDFYQWYHEKTVASVNSEYMPESVKTLFNSSPAFQYIYSDAAVHHGHAGAAHIANQFAASYASGEDMNETINKFNAQRKAYMNTLRKNQVARVNRSYSQKNISLRDRNTRISGINQKWASLNNRAFKSSVKAKQILGMEGS